MLTVSDQLFCVVGVVVVVGGWGGGCICSNWGMVGEKVADTELNAD